uniref:Endonuclease/exonuclease/phosphatase domain-containing protein n=1 Tax=Sinocyclocheilus grahami TaxID=75366 RepID=A0A672T1Q5_SINGR
MRLISNNFDNIQTAVRKVKQDSAEVKLTVDTLQDKMARLEDKSRQCNIRLVGLAEGEEVRMLLSLNDYLVIGGDFNTVHNSLLDRSQISHFDQTSSKLFNDFIKQINVCDVWRLRNEAVKDYTFFSARHKSYSRIDYLLSSPALI